MPPISAVIITLNEAENIGRCLASLKGVADEIIVVDAFSEDNTVAICQAAGATVHQRAWEGYAAAKNFGNNNASHDFILSIDADEVLSEELSAGIRAIKDQLPQACAFNRLTCYGGHWVRHCGWYPDTKLRLFNRHRARWTGDFVHEHLQLDPGIAVQHLSGDLLHYSFSGISDHLQRMDRYSTLAAREMFNTGKKSSWIQLTLSPALRFFKIYFLKSGFRDGFTGMVIAVISGIDIFIRYAKLAALQRSEKRTGV